LPVSGEQVHEDVHGPAPGELELVREFVNTFDLEDGTERLGTPEELAAWLDAHGLGGPGVGTEELERAIELRELLRALLAANNGEPVAAGTFARFAEVGASARASFAVDSVGSVSLKPAGGGVEGLIARIMVIVSRAQAEGTWGRLKACPAEDCAWAFYDRSRNSSRTWCSMGICGNRAKTRRYRQRRKAAHSGG
jgi:predicted RNA-binding Zn ribbon-like protein